MNEHPAEQHRHHIRPFLISKLEEFMIFGYGHVSEEDFWQYLIHKKWKKKRENTKIHELVNDLMGVSINDFMSFATVESYKTKNWFQSEDAKKLLQDLI